MVSGQWRYALGYVRGFVSGIREYRRKPFIPAPEPEPEDDPDVLLAQAQTEMRENQAKNRERAVQAITAKNNLRAEVDRIEKTVNNLQAKADKAIREGNQSLADQLLAQRDAYEVTLAKMRVSLAWCTEAVERVKVAMGCEEERIRAKTAQAMALKTQWKQQQIFAAIETAVASDVEEAIRPVRAEIRAGLEMVRRTDADLQQQAMQALRDSNRDLARDSDGTRRLTRSAADMKLCEQKAAVYCFRVALAPLYPQFLLLARVQRMNVKRLEDLQLKCLGIEERVRLAMLDGDREKAYELLDEKHLCEEEQLNARRSLRWYEDSKIVWLAGLFGIK